MTARTRRRPFRTAAAAAAVSAAALGALIIASPASAHDQLVSSDPAADASVEVMPDEMTLVYSGELIDAGDGTVVEVLSPGGTDVVDGDLTVDGPDVVVPLGDAPEAGAYEVTWRVVSNDGHPIDGSFSFAVETASAGASSDDAAAAEDETAADGEQPTEETAEPTAEPSEPTASEDAAPTDADAFLRNVPWIVIGVIVIAGGGAVIALLVGRARRLDDADGASRATSERREATGTIRTVDGTVSPEEGSADDADASGPSSSDGDDDRA